MKKKTLKKLIQFRGAVAVKIGKDFSYDDLVDALIDTAPEVPLPLVKRVKSL